MPQTLRRILIAGAGLSALALLLWYRLDALNVQAYIAKQGSKLPDTQVVVQDARISLLHGLGMRLTGVRLNSPSFSMQSDHVDVSVHLLPLLLGKIEISDLAIHQGTFHLNPSAIFESDGIGLTSLPIERIQLIRSHLFTPDGREVLDHIYLDLRDIGIDRETLWELQAEKGKQSLRGHGRLDFRRGEVARGFGKLKLKQVAVATLQPFTPDMLAGWFKSPSSHNSDNHLSGTLTLDITGHHIWSIFGEMSLESSRFNQPLRLRGKLIHPAEERMEWHDSFVHFDKKAAIAINGQCLKSNCNSSIKATNMPFSTWVKLFPNAPEYSHRFSARTDMQSELKWHPGTWQAQISVKLSKPTYQSERDKIALPSILIERAQARGSKQTWMVNGTAALARSKDRVNFTLNRDEKRTTTSLESQHLQDSWPTLANIILSSAGLEPSLKGDGYISGSVEMGRDVLEGDQAAFENSLILNLDAENASIIHPLFTKPLATKSSCNATILWWGERHDMHTQADLHECQLHTSKVESLTWKSTPDSYQLSSQGLSVDFDALQKQALLLPDILQPFHGQIRGSFDTRWDRNSQGLWPWVEQADGHASLQGLGTSLWQVNGAMQAEQGRFSSKHLHIQGIHGSANLEGGYDFQQRIGKLNVLSGNLDWQGLSDIPDGWQQVQLSGLIQQTHIKLLDNTWQNLSGRYKLKDADLSIKDMEAKLAGGVITSPRIKLSPIGSGISVEGKIRAQNIKLEEVAGLNTWLGATISGKLHANLQLRGKLPAVNQADWQGSNGDILIYSGKWSQDQRPGNLSEKMGLTSPQPNAHAFRKLEGRFRVRGDHMDIHGTRLVHNKKLYKGSARIDGNGEMQGSFSEDGFNYRLSGHWPKVEWTLEKK